MWCPLFIITYQCFRGSVVTCTNQGCHSVVTCTNQGPGRSTEIWQAQARWHAYVKYLSLVIIGHFPLYHFYYYFFAVTLTFRTRAKFELSPDSESWTSKWIDALKASSGKKLKIKSRKLQKFREPVQAHFFLPLKAEWYKTWSQMQVLGLPLSICVWPCTSNSTSLSLNLSYFKMKRLIIPST